MERQYKGYTITRIENGQMGCPGNQFRGARFYYEVTKDGAKIGTWSQLGFAKQFIDSRNGNSGLTTDQLANLRKSLLSL